MEQVPLFYSSLSSCPKSDVFHESRRCCNEDISKEVKRIQKRIRGFNWRKSPAWRRLGVSYGPKLNHSELVSIADLVATKLTIKPDRDARRRKIVMIKWFEEHWAAIEPLISYIVLEDGE
jgi:hypothetical protein